MTNAVLDKETFCRLVEEHQSAFYRTARSILSNQQDAEDAVQEAVCAAYSHLDRLREPEKFKSWLLRILVNECYDLCRRQRRTVDFDQAAEYLTTPEPDLAEHLTLWDAVLQREVLGEGIAQPHEDAPLDLSLDTHRIYRPAYVMGGHHPADPACFVQFHQT